ncbi:MAG: hypothetical protein ACKOUR_15275, partial [Planctomycetota bacterium]
MSSFPQHYALGYAAVAIGVAARWVWSLRGREVVRPHRQVGGAVAVGLVGILLWLGLSSLGLERQLAQWLPACLRATDRPGFNNREELTTTGVWVALIVVGQAGMGG